MFRNFLFRSAGNSRTETTNGTNGANTCRTRVICGAVGGPMWRRQRQISNGYRSALFGAILLAGLIVLGLRAASADAPPGFQDQEAPLLLDYTRAPRYGAVSLATGFWPDPYERSLIAGGPVAVAATALPSHCRGYVTAAPTLRLNWGGSIDALRIAFATAHGDPTLVINDPYGQWICSDDVDGLNPAVTIQRAVAGQYDIWVGTYSAGADHAGTLIISEFTTESTTTWMPTLTTRDYTDLTRGELALVVSPWRNLRRQAGLEAAWVGRVAQGATLELLEGPVIADGMAWWLVYTRETNRKAWISEGGASGQALAPVDARAVCGGADVSRVTIGDQVYVMSSETAANRVRAGASVSHAVVGQLRPGEIATATGGPRCADGYVWWYVVRGDLRGWTAERAPDRFYMAPTR